jgi:hypothetical protein
MVAQIFHCGQERLAKIYICLTHPPKNIAGKRFYHLTLVSRKLLYLGQKVFAKPCAARRGDEA